jgi:hypothetical protein
VNIESQLLTMYDFCEQYEQLDAEHRGLFDGIFACANSPSDGGALNSLVKLVDAHFDFEEVSLRKT